MVKKIKEVKESVLKEINKQIPSDRIMDDSFDKYLRLEVKNKKN